MATLMDPTLRPGAVQAFVAGNFYDYFSLLGMHDHPNGGQVVRAFLPWASSVAVLEQDSGAEVARLQNIDEAGFFSGEMNGRRDRFAYRLRVSGPDWTSEIEDPYRFGLLLQPMDIHLLREGTHLEAYKAMGAHCRTIDGI